MTLNEAIKYLQGELEFRHFLEIEPLGDAIKLGIEALKAVKVSRALSLSIHYEKLPGETED